MKSKKIGREREGERGRGRGREGEEEEEEIADYILLPFGSLVIAMKYLALLWQALMKP
jgi:hypothetical protein